MRIRSVLAATVLAVALAGAGASTAAAGSHDDHKDDDKAVCSPYFGGIVSLENKIFWGGAHCGHYLR
ncbi:hypothetical protein [Streptomyces sp. SCL15-4]|uniref:hypothetical protein n=1 Tax=Streptomyces sp. SCL15-4 TaxID=2967221 RepID=UPI00296617E3|nr:hypothetical protein [Streptomyces sp. SCL15-4]